DVFPGRRDGTFATPRTEAFGTFPQETLVNTYVLDVTGDGRPDLLGQLVVAFSTTLVLRTRVARADGTLGPPADVRFGNYDLASLVMADFNGDGFPDLAGNYRGDRGNVNPGNPDPNYAGGRIYLFFGQGDGTFPDVQIVEAEAPQGLAVADFNGDHRPDLVTA